MWATPKTNWTKDDFFNIEDFNRIKNNIAHLRDIAIRVYEEFAVEPVSDDKTYSDFLYADEINAIERNIEKVNNQTLQQNYGEKKVFGFNSNVMDFDDLNRWEHAILDLYNKLTNQINGRRSFGWNFGKREGL